MKTCYKFFLVVLMSLIALYGCNEANTKSMQPNKMLEAESENNFDSSILEVNFHPELDSEVLFSGKKNIASANGGQGHMMYPAYDLASFLAGVFTHAVIQNNVSESQKDSAQETANLAIKQFSEAWEQVDGSFFLPSTKQIVINGEKFTARYDSPASDNSSSSGQIVGQPIEVTPHFIIEQNGNSIVLMNSVSLNSKKGEHKKVNITVVESPHMNGKSSHDYWLNDKAENFQSLIYRMFHESFQLGLTEIYSTDISGKSADSAVTVRYKEGGMKRVERGVVISSSCSRIIFRTLRGAIKSVPPYELMTSCAST